MLKSAVLLSFLVAVVLGSPVKVPRSLEQSLRTKKSVDVFISLESTRPILSQIKELHFANKAERRTTVGSALQVHAAQSQKSLLAFLSAQGATVKSFWITNEVYVKGANGALISKLISRPDVLKIREELKEKILPVVSTKAGRHAEGELEWGVEKIGAQAAWAQGINGTGVRVGMMDSGVQYLHKALYSGYVGEYGWYAPIEGTEVPEDVNGHGTHVMGTIVGQGGIGVAPGAKWMACQNIPGGEAEDLACGQFFLCPTLPDGSAEDCTKGADLVSNSWGYADGNDFFDDVFEAWATAGIVPLFAAGNSGPSCSSLGSPGDSAHPALVTVGSTDLNDDLSGFSSFGPSVFGVVKPNIAAPGSDVTSSCIGPSNNEYCVKSGTSMATPHTAGVVALVASAHPMASVEDIQALLYENAADTITQTGRNCGDIPEGTYPNNHVGHGRLSAAAALLRK